MKVSSVAAVGAAVIALAAGSAQAACELRTIADFPVSLVDQRPVIAGRLDGRRARLLVSGAYDFSVLKPEAATRLGIRTSTAPVTELPTDRPYLSASLEAGKSSYNVGFTVSDDRELGKLDGALGPNALGPYDTEYDIAGGAVRMIRSRSCGSRELAYWNKDKPYSVMEMKREDGANSRDLVEVTLNGLRATALLDPGEPRSAITRAATIRANLQLDDSGGRDVAVVPTLKLDQEEVRSTRLAVIERPPTDYDLVLGADFFASHRVYVARRQQKVYFTYNGGAVFAAR